MSAKEVIFNFLSGHPEYRANVGLYDPELEVLSQIKSRLEDIQIKVFSADWCPDCRVQLPIFFSVILALDEDEIELEILEVTRDKMDEGGLADDLDILAIPTFIIMRSHKEIGRIIERPKESMEKDLAEILG
ncbi:MAG: thioredoxin family protein [Thermoplasmata archaeon]|nr:MAG: thioredoxin family protein [Thermoplasmata archaeon]